MRSPDGQRGNDWTRTSVSFEEPYRPHVHVHVHVGEDDGGQDEARHARTGGARARHEKIERRREPDRVERNAEVTQAHEARLLANRSHDHPMRLPAANILFKPLDGAGGVLATFGEPLGDRLLDDGAILGIEALGVAHLEGPERLDELELLPRRPYAHLEYEDKGDEVEGHGDGDKVLGRVGADLHDANVLRDVAREYTRDEGEQDRSTPQRQHDDVAARGGARRELEAAPEALEVVIVVADEHRLRAHQELIDNPDARRLFDGIGLMDANLICSREGIDGWSTACREGTQEGAAPQAQGSSCLARITHPETW